jgi:hypothetical protein
VPDPGDPQRLAKLWHASDPSNACFQVSSSFSRF